MGEVYFISDIHFGHTNVIRLSQRPFESIEEMDKEVIKNWNSRVKEEDTVYILGDFWYKGADNPVNYIRQLKGKKILIKGNHDTKALKNQVFLTYFEEIVDMKEIVLDGKHIVMCHYPLLEWNGYFRGSYMVYGHIHNNKPKFSEYILQEDRLLNAGVDIVGFMPVNFNELVERNIEFKTIKGFKGEKQQKGYRG